MNRAFMLIFFLPMLVLASCSKEKDNTPVTVRVYIDTSGLKRYLNWDVYLDSVRIGKVPYSPTKPLCYSTGVTDSAKTLDLTIPHGLHVIRFVSLDSVFSRGYTFDAGPGVCMRTSPLNL